MNRVLVPGMTVLVLMSWSAPAPAETVRVQLNWLHQAQYAGFYVADARGFYRREGLEVSITAGGPGIAPLEVLQRGEADVAVAYLPDALAARTRGADIVNVAQVFRRSSLALACRKSDRFHMVRDVAGRSIGVWNIGDEAIVRLWLQQLGIAPETVTLVPQAAHAADLIAGRVACATVNSYDEFWDVFGAGLRTSELLIVRFGDEGLGLLEDGLYASRTALDDVAFRRRLGAFLRATAAGWREARLHPDEAVAMILARYPGLAERHQERVLQSVLTLVPVAGPFGLLSLEEYQHAVKMLGAGALDPLRLREVAEDAWTHRVWHESGLAPPTALPSATQFYLSAVTKTRWFYVLNLVGAAAFGVAGFMRAKQRRYNLWGASILTFLPAVGGGTLRDLLIGGDRHPPFIFKDPAYLTIVLALVVVGTILSRLSPESIIETRGFTRALSVFDTAGLAVFTVVGAEVALLAGLGWHWMPICAALTTAGGGTLLDVVTGQEPSTFKGEPYEEVAIGGALLLYLLLKAASAYEHTPWLVTGAILFTLVATFVARLLIIRYGIRSFRITKIRSLRLKTRRATR